MPAPHPHAPSRPLAWALLALVALLAAACTSITSQGNLALDGPVDPREMHEPFPWQGERMSFSVQVAGVQAMTVDVEVGVESTAPDGTQFVELKGVAETFGLFATFYPLHDEARTFIHPRTWKPFFAVKDINERGTRRVYKVHYWHDQRSCDVKKEADEEVQERSIAIPSGTMDAISFVYGLRGIPLEPDSQVNFIVYDGWKLSNIYLAVQEQEEIWTPAGMYTAWRIDIHRELLFSHEPQGAIAGIFADPEMTIRQEREFSGNVWVVDDEHRTPVRMALHTSMGDVDMLLSAYQPPGSFSEVTASAETSTSETAAP